MHNQVHWLAKGSGGDGVNVTKVLECLNISIQKESRPGEGDRYGRNIILVICEHCGMYDMLC